MCIFCTQICAGMSGFQCVYSETQGTKEIKIKNKKKRLNQAVSVSQTINSINFSKLCLQKLTFVN